MTSLDWIKMPFPQIPSQNDRSAYGRLNVSQGHNMSWKVILNYTHLQKLFVEIIIQQLAASGLSNKETN